MKSSKPSISFFCPAYNDEKNLPILIPKVVNLLKKTASKFEIVIVEDGSPDDTANVADKLVKKFKPFVRAVHHKKNLGYGAALKRGFREANKYDYLFYTDGDNQYDVNEIKKFIPHLAYYDAVVGYRTNRSLTLRRKIQTAVFNYLIRILFGVKVRDINNSLKIIKKSVLSKLRLVSKSSFIEAEFFIKLHRMGASVHEVPVSHYPRIHGKASGGNITLILKTVRDMFYFWWGLDKGKIAKAIPFFVLLFVLSYFTFYLIYYPIPSQLVHITTPYFIQNGYVLYKDIIHHHTPLLWFFLLGFYDVVGFNYGSAQIFFSLVLLLTSCMVFITGNLLSSRAASFSVLFFGLLYFIFFSDNHLAESTTALLFIISFFFILRNAKTGGNSNLILAGFFMGLSVLAKQVTAVVIPIAILYFIVRQFYEAKRVYIFPKKAIAYLTGVSIAFIPIVIYFVANNAFSEFFYWTVIFNLTVYAKEAPVSSSLEGAKIALLFVSFIPIFFVLLKRGKFSKFKKEVLILIIVFSFPVMFALLPSFYINRLKPLFLLTSLGFGIILANPLNKGKYPRLLVVGTLFIFIFFSRSYLFSFVNYVENSYNQSPSKGYDINDEKAAEWIKKNTRRDEKIMNIANHYIYFLSERLPANKYIWPLPWLLKPYKTSASEIIKSPPRIVVDDKRNHIDYPQIPALTNWPFYKYLKGNYSKIAEFDNVEVYELQK